MDENGEVLGHIREVIESAAGPFADEVERVVTADVLCGLAAQVLSDLVDEARAAGVTWHELGEALGVSRQAAHERFRGRNATHHRLVELQAERLPLPGV